MNKKNGAETPGRVKKYGNKKTVARKPSLFVAAQYLYSYQTSLLIFANILAIISCWKNLSTS